MKMVARSLLLVLFKGIFPFLAAITVAGAGEIELRHLSPVFEKPDVFSPTLRIISPGKYETAAEAKRSFSVRHPIAYYGDFAPLKDGGFVSAEVILDNEGGSRFVAPSFQWQMPLIAVLLAGFGVSLFLFVREKKNGRMERDSLRESFFLILFPVLLRQILVLCETAFWGNALPSAADEPGYFKVVYDVLQGDFSGPWNFTAGLGVFYLPFILLTGAREYYDIALVFSYFDALIIAPGALAVFFLILKNFKVKSICAFSAVLIWAVYPFFIYHAELWNAKIFKPLAALPCFIEGVPDWWRFYSVCIGAGFNAMSDTPGLLTVLLTLWMAQKLHPNARNIFFIGAAFGFCCLVRINYIFFSPILAYICLARITDWNKLLFFKIAGAAAGGFLTIFIWQLLINLHQFGNPLVFGYSLHYLDFPPDKRPDTGFNWSTLLELQNIRFLIGGNKFLMTAGVAGLLFIRDSRLRSALTLMAVPLILFFFGYTHTYCDVRRFILMAFPVFIAAFCCACANCFAPEGKGWRKYLPFMVFPLMGILWFMPAEIYAICLCLLLLRTIFNLQQELLRGILIK